MVLAIDPGSKQSAYCIYNAEGSPAIVGAGILENHKVLGLISDNCSKKIAIEGIASYGMGVGKEVFDTCIWIGRFVQRLSDQTADCCKYEIIYRREVKLHICHSPKANDSTIRYALIDRFGDPGTKKNPGLLYGLKADMWSALAIAVTAHETKWGKT